MSCFQSDRDRSEGKIGESFGIGSGGDREDNFVAVVKGNMASRCL